MVKGSANIRLHLQDKMTIFSVSLARSERRRVGIEGRVVALVPSLSIKVDKIIAPVRFEILSLLVIGEGFNIVVQHIPRHVRTIEAFSPRLEGWSPEVHHDGLALAHILHRGIVGLNSSDLFVVNGPSDILGGPGHFVDVPFVLWVKAAFVFMALTLVVSISVDCIHGEWVLRD